MSRENAEAFRRAIDAFNERDAQGMMDVLSSDTEFIPLVAGVTLLSPSGILLPFGALS